MLTWFESKLKSPITSCNVTYTYTVGDRVIKKTQVLALLHTNHNCFVNQSVEYSWDHLSGAPWVNSWERSEPTNRVRYVPSSHQTIYCCLIHAGWTVNPLPESDYQEYARGSNLLQTWSSSFLLVDFPAHNLRPHRYCFTLVNASS